jgi:hypothetical protein
VDAWGRPIRLVVRAAGSDLAVQVCSGGRSGSFENLATQINYPPSPVPLSSFNCSVILHITKAPGVILKGYYCIRGAGLAAHPAAHLWMREWPRQSRQYDLGNNVPRVDPPIITDLMPGSMDLCIVPTPHTDANFNAIAIPFDVLPGETREIEVSIPRRP